MKRGIPASRGRRLMVLATGAMLWSGAVTPAAYADPPPWSPGYNDWLNHQRGSERHRDGKADPDFGLFGSRCNHEQVAGALGGAIGGFIGSRIGRRDGQLVATAAGAFFGHYLGTQIGRSMDQSDRSCATMTAPVPFSRTGDGGVLAWQNRQSKPVMW